MATQKNPRESSKTAPEPQDAIEILIADHEQVKGLFKQFHKLKKDEAGADDKADIVAQACQALTVHAQLEEEIFYPAVRVAIDDADLMDEALLEHAGARELIAQLEDMSADDDLYDAKVVVLSEQIAHHVEEEEGDMFPKAKKAKIDTLALGADMLTRKSELVRELTQTLDDEGAIEAPPPDRRRPQEKTRPAKG